LLERFRTGFFQGEVDSIILMDNMSLDSTKMTKLERYYTAEQIDTKISSFPEPLTTITNTNNYTSYSTNTNIPT
jgi:hypothetical protein